MMTPYTNRRTISGTEGRKTIDRETLRRYVNEGLTLDQMVERWKEETGTDRARSSFAVAMSRYGIESAHPTPRYEKELPWRVSTEHGMAYAARMLRYLGRRNSGKSVPPEWEKKLDAWLKELDEMDAVIHYDPLTEQGFFPVPREPEDGDGYTRMPRDN